MTSSSSSLPTATTPLMGFTSRIRNRQGSVEEEELPAAYAYDDTIQNYKSIGPTSIKNNFSGVTEHEEPIVISEDHLARSLTARQIQMIAIAGVIGTGLFLGTGKSLATGGPASMLICYSIVGLIVFLTMMALGEMATFIPVAGSFCVYATRFVGEPLGFALTWNYWFNDAVSTASDLTALQLVFEYWSSFPGWVIALIFWVFLIAINAINVKAYGELEYWLALLKVITIVVFIILGIVVNCGGNKNSEYIGFKYWHLDGAPFVHGFRGFASVFVTASFAYGGTESIGVTAGETKNPSRTMPKVVKTVFWRIVLFYVLAVLIIGINVPYNYPNLSNKSSTTSPFTITFQLAGSNVAGSFMNAVIMTSVISAGNHALFAGSRVMYSLAQQGYAPRFIGKLTPQKVPWVALAITALISGLCFGSSFIGAGTLWNWLQNLVGVSNQLCWLCICISSIRFRMAVKAQGKEHLLPFVNWTYPYGPIVAAVLSFAILLIQGWTAFSPWSVSDFFSYYVELIIMPVMIFAWWLWKRFPRFTPLVEIDLETDRHHETEEERLENEYFDSLKGWPKWRSKILEFFV